MKNTPSALCLLFVVIFFGCYPHTQPLYIQNNFPHKKIESISVLPVIDLRFDKSKNLTKLDKWVHGRIKFALKKRKFKPSFEKDRQLIKSVNEDQIASNSYEWIKNINHDGRWILLPVLHDSSSKLTFGSSGNAELSIALYDKQNLTKVWEHKAIGQDGQGGLAGMMMKGMMEQSAIQAATLKAMQSFPQNR